jgi:preprotein translocase subunit YajC
MKEIITSIVGIIVSIAVIIGVVYFLVGRKRGKATKEPQG